MWDPVYDLIGERREDGTPSARFLQRLVKWGDLTEPDRAYAEARMRQQVSAGDTSASGQR